MSLISAESVIVQLYIGKIEKLTRQSIATDHC